MGKGRKLALVGESGGRRRMIVTASAGSVPGQRDRRPGRGGQVRRTICQF